MNKALFWILLFSSVIGFGYLISTTLIPFILAFIFAYLLQPVIDNNARRFNLPRNIITIGIFGFFISSFIVGMAILAPVIYRQITAFISKIPIYKNNFNIGMNELLTRLHSMDSDIANRISDSMQSFANSAFSIIAAAANNIWNYTLATINFFAIIALVPVILYYLLRDWPEMVEGMRSILPVKGKRKIEEIFFEINQILSAYIRGQLNICLLLSIYYVVSLSLLGLDLALLIGIISGFLIILPFIGPLISLFLMLITCYVSYGASIKMLYVFIIFIMGYIAESTVLTPKIIGDKIGLHPVWIIFSVFAAGSLFGFIGIVFAIPIAGIIKILLFHMISSYKSSKIYKD